MQSISIYSVDGMLSGVLELPEDVDFVSGRTSKSKTCYYKGVGSFYKGHASLDATRYNKTKKNSIFYYGYDVENQNWKGKFGIFQERFQPYFSDFIGTCGPKERSIKSISTAFSHSAVEVLERVDYDIENQQSYYKLQYTSPRDSFLDGGKTIDFVNLIDCMLHEGWNFPWDKASARDVNKLGRVTDVADLFFSHGPIHKMGTIYSLLFSIFSLSPFMYVKLASQMGFGDHSQEGIPLFVYFIMDKLGFGLPMRRDITDRRSLYVHLIGNILLRGRNCASVENPDHGNMVMLSYVDRFKATLPEKHKRILMI